MSYSGASGLGCVGGCAGGCGCSGMGAYFPNQRRRALRGFGSSVASTFNAAAVWADAQSGGAGNNLAGGRAAKAIQAGLSELGYSCPPTGSFDNATIAQWKSFKANNGLPAGVGIVQKDGLVLMEAQLKQGKVTGPDVPVAYVTEGGEYIKEDSIVTKKAGISTGLLLLLGAVVVGGVIIYAKKQKSKGGTTMSTGRARDMDSYGGGSSGLYASVKE